MDANVVFGERAFFLNSLLICLCPLIVLAVGDDPDDSGFRYFFERPVTVLLFRSPERDVLALLDRLHTIRL
jgi:hypothetical protein